MLPKRLIVLLMSLCTLCGAASAVQPRTDLTQKEQKEQKALQKAQKKKIRQEARRFESLRNDAVVQFAREHQPSDISTPSFVNDFRISNVICAGDNISGTVMLHFDITPLYGGFRLYMGGERNGTYAFAKGLAFVGPLRPHLHDAQRPARTYRGDVLQHRAGRGAARPRGRQHGSGAQCAEHHFDA